MYIIMDDDEDTTLHGLHALLESKGSWLGYSYIRVVYTHILIHTTLFFTHASGFSMIHYWLLNYECMAARILQSPCAYLVVNSRYVFFPSRFL
jgi:hypothetical protein